MSNMLAVAAEVTWPVVAQDLIWAVAMVAIWYILSKR